MAKRIWLFVLYFKLCEIVLTSSGQDVEVSCVFWETCVLPCAFTPGDDPVIHWTKEPEDIPVHIHYHGQNQLQDQHKNYRDRTSLSDQDIATGDASLQLHKVNVRDEGRYKCYVSTVGSDKTSHVNLKVYAPVSEISLQQEEERLLFSSENIYPKPAVSWTFRTEPEPDPQTSIMPSETGLFSVLSSVPLIQDKTLEYSCNVSTETSWRSATYRRNISIIRSASAIVPCTEPKAPVKRLVWRFKHRQIILNKTGSDLVYNESWRPFVDGLTKSNNLVLKDLTQDQMGLFTCELSTESEDFIINIKVREANEGILAFGIMLGILFSIALCGTVMFYFIIKACKRRSGSLRACRGIF